MREFATIFLALIFETTPFLLLGVVISVAAGPLIERALSSAATRVPVGGAVAGIGAGMLLPMCDCGSRPLAHRLALAGRNEFAVAFLVASPVVNPIVVITTWLAFRDARLVALRLGITVVMALVAGLVLASLRTPLARELVEEALEHEHGPDSSSSAARANATGNLGLGSRWTTLSGKVLGEFFELFPFLVGGSALAAAIQVLVDQSVLRSGGGVALSIAGMMVLAFLLSICSSVDAFVAAGFGAALGTGPLLAFLTLGPLVNLKSMPMYARLFSVPAVLLLVVLVVQISFGAAFIVEYRAW